MDSKKIGKLIARKRKEKQMTQSQLAEQLGVTNKTVSKWETGAGLPDISLLIDLSKELEISVDDLLNGNEENGEKKLEHSYVVTKQNYKKYLINQYFQNKCIWIIDLAAIMLFLGGLCCLPLKQYLTTKFDIFAKVCLLFAVLLFFIPALYFIIRLRHFKKYEVQYTIDNDSIIYSGLGEKATFYLQDLILIRDHKMAYLLAKSKILWISLNDAKKIDNRVQTKSAGRRVFSFFLLLILIAIVISCVILQLGYIFVLKRFGFEYIHQQVEYIIYIIVFACIFNVFMVMKLNMKKAVTSVIISLFVIIGLNMFLKYQSSLLVIDSFSPDFSHHAVLKYDMSQRKLFDYHYTYLCFARKSDVIDTSGLITKKGYWITNDCYVLVYQDFQQEQQVHVSTFGDRGNGISYYYVSSVLDGAWYNLNDGETKTIMKAEKGNITLIQDQEYYFGRSDIQQNGTIALTLFQNDKAKFIIILNEDCFLEDNGLLNADGTITLFNIDDMSSVTLYCGTYKEDKTVQEQIDQKMREQAVTLVNKMNKLLKEDPQLDNFKDSDQMFHLDSSSQDCFTVSKEAYFNFEKLFHKSDNEESGQITNIKIIAGDIKDFYTEITYSNQYLYHGETETSKTNVHYRIKQGKNCYLIATIGYRVPGDIGLKKNEPVFEQNMS